MKKQPNVVVFFTDQQRWDTMGLHGNPLGLTPNLDRVAMENTDIHHCFTCQPVCGPARAALQSGLYPTVTGCFRNKIPLPLETRTLAHCFKDAGYRTGYIGKWHLGGEEPVTEPHRGGYDYWLGSELLEFVSSAYDTVLFDNENKPVKLPGYRVDALTDAAVRYVDANRENPFFLFVSYLEPHFQNSLDDYPAPDGYRERYTGRWMPPDLASLGGTSHQHIGGYYGMVKRLDEAYGRVLDALKSLGIADETIVLFTSYHGCHFKTRNDEYKRSGHESSIRIPAVLSGPGFKGGGRIAELVSLLDLPPTLLDAAGIPVPEGMQGKSLLPLVQKRTVSWPEEVFVQISESQVGRAVRTRRWKYIVSAPGKDPNQDAGSDWYVEEALYDLACDPYELTNLIGLSSHGRVADVMRDRLVRRMTEAGEQAPHIVPAEARESGNRKVLDEELMQ